MQPSLLSFQRPALSVTQITQHIQQLLERDEILQDVWLEGEISNWSQAASGHIYFTLKDARASIRCVIWRSWVRRLGYRPQGSGEAILAHGRVAVYEVGGVYQFYVDDVEPAGLGALYAQFERLKNQLAAEGLFDVERKHPIPAISHRIGVVTSAQAAALRDVLTVLSRRYPLGEVILSPTPVQGDEAPPQIIAALNSLITLIPPVDVILLVRGGGSIEDLWAFNDEGVARTIAASPIPIVTGVGHETDFTIADFVADYRAPTPSAAAELVTPDIEEIKRQLGECQARMFSIVTALANEARADLKDAARWLYQLTPQKQIDNRRQQVDDQVTRLGRLLGHKLTLHGERLASAKARLKTLNPEATLARGYAIVRKGDYLITHVGDVEAGDGVTVTLQDGEFEATVTNDD